jgi:hypothetical protein
MALCVGVLLVVVTGSFTVRYTGGINDRYLIWIVPVLVVASVAIWWSGVRPRSPSPSPAC